MTIPPSRPGRRRAATAALALAAVLALVLGTASVASATPDQRSTARADCFDWRSAVAGYTGWAVSKSDCSYFGSSSTKSNLHRKGYSWQVPPTSNGRICVEARGYRWHVKKKKVVKRWYSLGCGTSGGGTVPWYGAPYRLNGTKYFRGVAATPVVRAKVQPGFLGGAYRWAH